MPNEEAAATELPIEQSEIPMTIGTTNINLQTEEDMEVNHHTNKIEKMGPLFMENYHV